MQRYPTDLLPTAEGWHYVPEGSNEPSGFIFSTLAEALAWPELKKQRALAALACMRIPLEPAYQPDNGSGLFLPHVKTIVYTIEANRLRQQRVTTILDSLGFNDWAFFYGQKTNHYGATIPNDHARLLTENQPPLLILEDDVELRAWESNLSLPIKVQLAMLGGGRDGDRRGYWNARLNGLTPTKFKGYAYDDVDDHWMRVYGMWYTHALLHLDRRTMDQLAAAWLSEQTMIDATTARNQWRWNVFCRKIPMLWQNDGHHRKATWSYAPRDPQLDRFDN